jgi:hypothetical protein
MVPHAYRIDPASIYVTSACVTVDATDDEIDAIHDDVSTVPLRAAHPLHVVVAYVLELLAGPPCRLHAPFIGLQRGTHIGDPCRAIANAGNKAILERIRKFFARLSPIIYLVDSPKEKPLYGFFIGGAGILSRVICINLKLALALGPVDDAPAQALAADALLTPIATVAHELGHLFNYVVRLFETQL